MLSYVEPFLGGAVATVWLSLLSLAVATIIGLVVAMGQTTQNVALDRVARGYVVAVRYTPELVQLYLIYFSLPVWGIVVPAFVSAVIVFGLHSGAFISEIFRGGILSIDRTQWEASRVLGIKPATMWRKVILPQVVKRVLPAWGNYVLIIVKITALASLVTVHELFYTANRIATVNFRFFEVLTLLALFYYAINLVGSIMVRRLERRLARIG